MGVFKKGNNWYIDYYLPNRRRKREKVGEDKKLAEMVLQKRKIQIAENKFLDIDRPKRIKLRVFCSTFLEGYSKPNKITWKSDEFHLDKLCEYFGDINLDEITSFKIEEFKRFRLRDDVRYSTVNRTLACLRTMLNKAIEWDVLKESPMKRVKLYKENNIRLRFLEKEEITRLLEVCAPHIKRITIFALNTGMRRGEILNLKWSDVDLKNNFICLHETKSKEKRVVPINSVIKHLLSEINEEHYGSDYIFNGLNSDKIKSFRRGFENALKRAKIEDFRFHDLRHTFASHLVMNGVDLNTVRELLGHKKIEMTLRYAHLSHGHKVRAVELLGQQIDTIETPMKQARQEEKLCFS